MKRDLLVSKNDITNFLAKLGFEVFVSVPPKAQKNCIFSDLEQNYSMYCYYCVSVSPHQYNESKMYNIVVYRDWYSIIKP